MKIDFNQELKDVEGKSLSTPTKYKINDRTGELSIGDDGQYIILEKSPIKLSTICINALMSNKQNEDISGEEKVSRYILASKIKQSKGLCEVSSEEIVKIKQLIGTFMSTMIVGASFNLLEGKNKE